jgi:hypothetical protein
MSFVRFKLPSLLRPTLLRSRRFSKVFTASAFAINRYLSLSHASMQGFNGPDKSEGESVYKPPEEPLFLPSVEGYGYHSSARVGHRINQYEIVRKASPSSLSESAPAENAHLARMGWFLYRMALCVCIVPLSASLNKMLTTLDTETRLRHTNHTSPSKS